MSQQVKKWTHWDWHWDPAPKQRGERTGDPSCSTAESPGSQLYNTGTHPPPHQVKSNLGERQLLPQLISAGRRLHWSATISINRLFLYFLSRERKVSRERCLSSIYMPWTCWSWHGFAPVKAQRTSAVFQHWFLRPLWNPELKAVDVEMDMKSIQEPSKINELSFAAAPGESTKRHRGVQALSYKVSARGDGVKMCTYTAPCFTWLFAEGHLSFEKHCYKTILRFTKHKHQALTSSLAPPNFR